MGFSATVLKDIAGKIQLMPLRGVQFISQIAWGDDQDANLIIYNIESESMVKLKPITRKTDKGGSKQLGYMLDAVIYIPYNDSSIIGNTPDVLFGPDNNAYTVTFLFGNAEGYSDPAVSAPKAINYTNSLKLQINNRRLRYIKEYESIEYRPRLIIKIQGFIKNTELLWT